MPRNQSRQQDWQRQVMGLTQSLLEQWYGSNPHAIVPYLDAGASWIGAAEGQYFLGREQVVEALEQASHSLVPCRLSRQSYDVTSLGKEACVVTGQIVVTLQTEDQLLTEPQRITMVWRNVNDKLWLAHIHVSNNAAVIAPDEDFPLKASRAAYRYLQLKLQASAQMCAVCAADGTWHNFSRFSVIYLEGDNEYTLVYCQDRTIRIHRQLCVLRRLYFDFLICVHRSYYVNPLFISVLRPYEIILSTGTQLPVARSRYTGVCTQLAGSAAAFAKEEGPSDEK